MRSALPRHRDQNRFESVLHPTDLSRASDRAFVMALKIALRSHARLTVLHSDIDGQGTDWNDFPSVRAYLKRWGVIAPDASKRDVVKLGLKVRKLRLRGEPIDAVAEQIAKVRPDLMVVATHAREGLDRFLKGSMSETLMRKTMVPTIFLPHAASGFVDLQDGRAEVNRILIPVANNPRPGQAIEMAGHLVRSLKLDTVEFRAHYVGNMHEMPSVNQLAERNWKWTESTSTGNTADEIVKCANEIDADVVVMATRTRLGALDTLLGSTVQRVLRRVRCPVMAVPT